MLLLWRWLLLPLLLQLLLPLLLDVLLLCWLLHKHRATCTILLLWGWMWSSI